jgi:hypothetical protein
VAAQEEGSAFVPWMGGELSDILCERRERTVGADNCVKFEKRTLQIPADKHRCRYVKAKVEVHRYLDERMAIFHGSRKLADYTAAGKEVKATGARGQEGRVSARHTASKSGQIQKLVTIATGKFAAQLAVCKNSLLSCG